MLTVMFLRRLTPIHIYHKQNNLKIHRFTRKSIPLNRNDIEIGSNTFFFFLVERNRNPQNDLS